MTVRSTLLRAAPALALGVLLAFAAGSALAQGALSGGVDPVQTGRNALTLVLAVLTVLAAVCWAGAGAACFRGHIPVGYFWAAGIGTMIIAGCTFISNRLSGGGGGFSLGA